MTTHARAAFVIGMLLIAAGVYIRGEVSDTAADLLLVGGLVMLAAAVSLMVLRKNSN